MENIPIIFSRQFYAKETNRTADIANTNTVGNRQMEHGLFSLPVNLPPDFVIDQFKYMNIVKTALINIFQRLTWCPQIAYFVQPTIQNPNIVSLLLFKTKNTGK